MEQHIYDFITSATPISILALAMIIIFMQVKNSGIIQRLRGTQLSDKQTVSDKVGTDEIDLKRIFYELKTIQNNHLHELPTLIQTVNRIEATQTKQGERIAGVETQVAILVRKL